MKDPARSRTGTLMNRARLNRPRIKSAVRFGGLVLLAILTVSGLLAAGQKTETIMVDAQHEGRTFEGIGAVSAGASSRLLIDYAEPQRSEILDYLFKPNFGAGFQHLKAEIGGDVHAADGCEPLHVDTHHEEAYTRGLERGDTEAAKQRHPGILLAWLACGAPDWVGAGGR